MDKAEKRGLVDVDETSDHLERLWLSKNSFASFDLGVAMISDLRRLRTTLRALVLKFFRRVGSRRGADNLRTKSSSK